MRKVINILFNDFVSDNRVLKESRTLVNNGYDVTLLATHFDKNLPEEEEIDGIKVKRVGVGGIKLLPLNLILFWIHIVRNYKNEKIFHCNDLYGLPPAYFIKKFLKKDIKIVYDCHEHETEAQIYIGNPLLKCISKFAEKKMIYSADKVIVVSKSIGEDYMKIYGIDEPYLIMNCSVLQDYKGKDYFRKRFNIPKDNVIFLYVGIHKEGRGLEKLVELFREASKENKKISLVLLSWGDNIYKLKEAIKDDRNIFLHDRISLDKFMACSASADWGVLLLENISKNNDFALPNKLFDYVMTKSPVIVSNLKEMERVVKEENVGYVVNYENNQEVIDAFNKIDINTKKQFLPNLEKMRKKYNWEEQEKTLLKLYNSL